MKAGMLNLLKEVLSELLKREARRMSVAEDAMRPFTPLERLVPLTPRGCSGLAA